MRSHPRFCEPGGTRTRARCHTAFRFDDSGGVPIAIFEARYLARPYPSLRFTAHLAVRDAKLGAGRIGHSLTLT